MKSPGMIRRPLAALILAVMWLGLTASPAAAHGGGDDVSNFRSEISSDASPGLRWQLVGGGALLELTNTSDEEVIVMGYQGEPYLRFASTGEVSENVLSPATEINKRTDMSMEASAGTDPDAPPSWRTISDDGTYRWHDHRIHWMGAGEPDLEPGVEHRLSDWVVPYTVAGRPAQVEGTLWWTSPPSPVPWLVGSTLLLSVPLLVVLARRRGVADAAGRVLAIEVIVVAALNLVRMVDDLVAVPATPAEQLLVVVANVAWVAIACAAARMLLASEGPRLAACFVAGGAVAYGLGLSTREALSASYLQTSLPPGLIRSIVALSISMIVPSLLAGVALERRFRSSLEPVERAAQE